MRDVCKFDPQISLSLSNFSFIYIKNKCAVQSVQYYLFHNFSSSTEHIYIHHLDFNYTNKIEEKKTKTKKNCEYSGP